METVKDHVVCEGCGGRILLIRVRVLDRRGDEPRLRYLAKGDHDIENVEILGKEEPDVIVTRCPRVSSR